MSEAHTILHITVNGEAKSCPAGASVATLLETLGLTGKRLAVERNLAIVPRSQYANVSLADDDAIEIVQFIGGG